MALCQSGMQYKDLTPKYFWAPVHTDISESSASTFH